MRTRSLLMKRDLAVKSAVPQFGMRSQEPVRNAPLLLKGPAKQGLFRVPGVDSSGFAAAGTPASITPGPMRPKRPALPASSQ